jgi:hypothetical protein
MKLLTIDFRRLFPGDAVHAFPLPHMTDVLSGTNPGGSFLLPTRWFVGTE